MYNPEIFASGVYGVGKVYWVLRCETPLVIRNGKSITYTSKDKGKDNAKKKTKGMGVWFKWREPSSSSKSEHSVAALHYGYRIHNGVLESFHFVPPSSIRGSLRSWTINHLVKPAYRSKMSPPRKENEDETLTYLENLREALADANSGYAWIASLFGLAFESRQDGEFEIANAGRLRIETVPFESESPSPIFVNGTLDDEHRQEGAPTNVRRQMVVRNPLDRMTHAPKEDGLHQFLEFSRGETFKVKMTILNPQKRDLGLLSLWRDELNNGMLRLGALSSIGRGRVSIQDEKYSLWLRPGISTLKEAQPLNDALNDDALAGLWKGYSIAPDDLHGFVKVL